jgi:adiponectin receptor
MGFLVLSGLGFYSKFFPEKSYPKKFDIWLNSHTIWHILGILGSMAHYKGMLVAYATRSVTQCPVS